MASVKWSRVWSRLQGTSVSRKLKIAAQGRKTKRPTPKTNLREWDCPIDYPGCTKNCGNYGCGN